MLIKGIPGNSHRMEFLAYFNLSRDLSFMLISPYNNTCSVAVRYKKSISIIETVISIDYRYIDFLASYFSDRSRGIDRVGDN